MSLTPPPTAPTTSDPSTFSARADALVAWYATNVTELGALQTDVSSKQATASSAASSASLSASVAAGYGTATAWVSGTTYAIGDVRYGLINFQPYRRKTAGAGTTDPSLDAINWISLAPASGISTVASITSSTTLTVSSAGYQVLAMTSLGQSVTLPDATTLTVGGPKYILDNVKGGYPVGIRDSAGGLIMAVAAGGEAFVSLKDSSTAAGIWSVTGTNLEPGLITIDSTFSSTYASTVLAPFVALDNNTSIHFAALAAGFAAFVVDNTGRVLTTPVTVSSTANDVPAIAFKVSSTSAILFYGQTGTSTHKAVVLTLSGSSPSLSLAVGTPQTLTVTNSTAKWGGEDFVSAPKVAQLSGTLYVASYCGAGTEMSAVAISVSGAAVTIGTPASILGASAVPNSTTTYPLTATAALVLYKTVPGNYQPNAVIISVAGTVCTVNTSVALTGLISASTTPSYSCLLSATKCIVVDDNNTTTPVAVALTISAGTAITAGTPFTVETGVAGFNAGATSSYTANSATRYNAHLWPLSANTAGLWYLDSSGVSRVVVLTESSGTVTAGMIMYNSVSTGSSGAGTGQMLPQGTSEFLSIKQQQAAAAGYWNVIEPGKISGTNISYGASKPLRDTYQNVATQIYPSKLSSGDYVITGSAYTTVASIFRSNGDVINFRGNISIPFLQVCTTMQSGNAVANNRLVLMGQTTQGGSTVAFNVPQLRLLSIEIAQ